MADRILLSVVVITKNEAANIVDCLKSVYDWADELLVVDDESTDNTRELCRSFSDKIFVRKMDNEGSHRNWAYAQAKNNWVLSLDADERITPELQKEVAQVLQSPKDYNAFAIPRRNYIGNYWVKYCGWYPSAQLRLFKKDKFKYEEVEVHPRVFLDGKCGVLKSDMIHYSYKGFEDFLGKLNRQTTMEAKKWVSTNRKMSLGVAIWRTMDRFPRSYIRKKGYKEGFMGFMIAFFASLYQIISYAKFVEMKKRKAE